MENLDGSKRIVVLRIVVLIDADNAQSLKVKAIMDEISTRGRILVKRAYGDWSSNYLNQWKDKLNELAIEPIQQLAYTKGKNSTDIAMVIDAMDLLYSEKFDVFTLVSSDSDFTKLASRLKESGVFVFGVGESKTPGSFRNVCDDFILTENLDAEEETGSESAQSNTIEELIPFLRKGWQQYQHDDGWAYISDAGNFLKRAKSDFDPRSYGFNKLTGIIKSLNEFEIKYEGVKCFYRYLESTNNL